MHLKEILSEVHKASLILPWLYVYLNKIRRVRKSNCPIELAHEGFCTVDIFVKTINIMFLVGTVFNVFSASVSMHKTVDASFLFIDASNPYCT